MGLVLRYHITNLLITLRNDKELHRTTTGVDNLVEYKRGDNQVYITIDNLLPTTENKVTSRYDGHIH